MPNPKKSRRGFFFTAMALAILSFMLLTTQVWVRTFEQKDEHAAARFKGEAMRVVLSTLSDRGVSDFANASAFYATYRLVEATQIWGLAQMDSSDPLNPKTGAVEKAAHELMMGGNSSNYSTYPIEYSQGEKESYTLASWQGKIRSAANVMGMNASFGEVENFTFRQEGPWSVRVYFEMQMNISDLEKTMHQSKRLKANTSFSINGFTDPFVVRNELDRRPSIARDPSLVAQKQIWKHANYISPSDLAPALADGMASEGNGWFFGPMTDDYPGTGIFSGGEEGRIDSYVLVHGYDDNLSNNAGSYGAVVVTSAPVVVSSNYINSQGCNVTEHNQTRCLNCLRWVTVNSGGESCAVSPYIYQNQVDVPMVVASGQWSNNASSIPSVVREGLPSQKFILIDNEFAEAEKKDQGYHRIWDITRLRDMAICGFYVQGDGPSFFQRMLANQPSATPLKNPDLGIESFLVGKWAGGMDDQENDILSRLDWEFYQSSQPPLLLRAKGMMGCKSKAMCGGQNATLEGVGKFRLSQNATERYSLKQIACAFPGLTSSPCD